MDGNKNKEKIDSNKFSSRTRHLTSFYKIFSIFLTALGILISFFYLFSIGVSFWGDIVIGTAYLQLIIGCFLPQTFLYFSATKKNIQKVPWYDGLFSLLSFAIPIYFFLKAQTILGMGWEVQPPLVPFIFGIVLWGLTLEATRRTVGFTLFLLVLIFSTYPLYASHMPWIFFAKSYSLQRVVGYSIFGPEGIVGVPMRVMGYLFIGFMLFGVALTYTGGAKFFLNLSLCLLGKVRGGIAKVAILSSALVGSISGSVLTNIITTGSFTIPAMNKSGYARYYAASIEACASSGASLMPPVMGAAAFVMASILNISYTEVCVAAVLPSFLYFFGLFVQVDGYAAKNNIRGMRADEIPSALNSLKEGWFYILAFAALLYVLFVEHHEAQAPFYGTVVILLVSMFKKETRLNLNQFADFIQKVGMVMCELVGTICAIGILIGALFITGVAQSLTSDLIQIAGDNSFILVGIGAIASFVLGMGLTVTACYLLLAVLLAPALVQAGFDQLASHIFLIYCGCLSYITPPVAIGAYAAGAIAEANPMKTAFQAVKLGAVKYFIPFLFIFNPSLILQGSFIDIIMPVITAIIGVFFLASSIEGYIAMLGNVNIYTRVVCFIGGLLLMLPGWKSNTAGAIFISVAILVTVIKINRKNDLSYDRSC